MNEAEALSEASKLFGADCFAETDDAGTHMRYYVGACPAVPGPYEGYMGFSWEEALTYAREKVNGGR